MLTWPVYHDPNETAAYEVDFTGRLADEEVIESLSVSLPKAAGMNVTSTAFDEKKARASLSGGNAGYWGRVLFRVVTDQGQHLDETIRLRVMNG